MPKKRLIVTLTDAGTKAFSATTKAVAECGITVTERMPELGILIGEVSTAALGKTTAALNTIKGVTSVEEEGTSQAI